MIPPPDFDPTDDSEVALLQSEKDRLRAQLETWPKKSRQEKAARREELITEFLKTRKLDPTNPWARGYLRGKLALWLSNHAGSRETRLPKSLKCLWTGREVFNIKEDARIAQRKEEVVDGGKVPIAAWNIARSELWNALTEDEQAAFEETADQWMENGPDPELRALIAEKRLGDWIQAIILWVHDQCGAMARLEFCVLDKTEEMVHGVHDVSMIWHAGNRKVPTFAQWGAKNPKRTWQEYCHACYHPDEHDDDTDAPRATLPPHEFQFFDDGTPVLPPIDDFRYGKIMSVVLHTFLSLHWEGASGIKGEPVAWKAVAKETARYLPADALPDEFIFQNPMRMSVDGVKQLWTHIRELQVSGETRRERFRWTHWWKRVGKGEDAGERHKAAYGSTPRPRHIAEAKRKGHAARTKRAPPPGAFAAKKAGDKRVKGPTKAKGDPKGKGKGKAVDYSDSAESSGVGTDPEAAEPSLRSEGSPDTERADSGEEETFDLNVSRFDGGTTSGVDDDLRPRAGPSKPQKPKPKPKRKHDGRIPPDASPEGHPLSSPEAPPEGSPESTPGPETLPHIPGPWDDAPVGRMGLATVRIPPRVVHLEAATGKPPSWVENDPERVLPFLWALSREADYRHFLKSWRHMFRRRSHLRDPQVSHWANWDSDCWGVPSHVHAKREHWAKLMEWISDQAPTPITACSDLQQWALIVGLALRDIYTGNEVDPDPEEPVPGGGPDYLRHTVSLLRDAVDHILPLCTTSLHPGPPAASALPAAAFAPPGLFDSASSVPLSRKGARIMGKRGAPPGVRPAAIAVKNAAKANNAVKAKAKVAAAGGTSADEVEMAVTGKIGSTSTSDITPTASASIRPRKLATCFVEIPAPPSRRASTAARHQEAPDVQMDDEEEPVPLPVPPRRSLRKNKGQGM
ncbi:hypothetical protein OH76DRAFT_1489691 [Lentinus brumalis]|uniref:Uncharacterized protein n=1 Tax=Lentinus brumalis TaxID=2498619 RepID=A0A371CLP0_9APHY|nr:hypothetical protein OH76DRAFT_1489691 [Polyporus brumalis]